MNRRKISILLLVVLHFYFLLPSGAAEPNASMKTEVESKSEKKPFAKAFSMRTRSMAMWKFSNTENMLIILDSRGKHMGEQKFFMSLSWNDTIFTILVENSKPRFTILTSDMALTIEQSALYHKDCHRDSYYSFMRFPIIATPYEADAESNINEFPLYQQENIRELFRHPDGRSLQEEKFQANIGGWTVLMRNLENGWLRIDVEQHGVARLTISSDGPALLATAFDADGREPVISLQQENVSTPFKAVYWNASKGASGELADVMFVLESSKADPETWLLP